MNKKMMLVVAIMAMCSLVFVGCGKKTDQNTTTGETKTASEAVKTTAEAVKVNFTDAVDKIKAELPDMNVEQLQSAAVKYKDELLSKKVEVDKLTQQLKEIPVTEMLGDKAKQLKSDVDAVTTSVKNLKERFDLYYNELKQRGADLSGLEIK